MLKPGHVVVEADAPRDVWLEERGEGVTASEALDIARGGASTRQRILETKLNGSTFKGNKWTRAGSEREAALIDAVAEHVSDVGGHVEPNAALWGADFDDLYRATPDGIGELGDERLIVEVKSHAHGWSEVGIPEAHFAQMQWQMLVMGAARGFYAFEVRDEDEQPPIDGPTILEVARDEEYIDWLAERAARFIDWREAGCPPVDEMPDELAAANEAWQAAKNAADVAVKAEKAAAAQLKKLANAEPHARRFGVVRSGESGGFQLSVSWKDEVDLEAWGDAMPLERGAYQELTDKAARATAAAEDYISEAIELGYKKPKRTERLLQQKGKKA